MGVSKETAELYARKYPNAGNRTLARMAYRDEPLAFTTEEAAYTAIRRIRGAQGVKNRTLAQAPYMREQGEQGHNLWAGLPQPVADFSACVPFEIPEQRILVLSDIHFPFHDLKALEIALEHGYKAGVDSIILNGDILDCYALSRFVTDPRLRNFGKEIGQTKDFLQILRANFPDPKIRFRRGNHEARYQAYMETKAPELLGISEMFELKNVLGLDALGIDYHEERDYFKVGRLNIIHGHEFGKGGGVNAARWLFLKAKATAMCGHFHRVDAHSGRDMHGKVTSTWTTGCLCGLSPDYLRYNDWSHGFSIVESDGYNFAVQNHRIIEGRVY